MRMRNKPGALARVAARLAKAGVNIKSVYASTAGRSAAVVIHGWERCQGAQDLALAIE